MKRKGESDYDYKNDILFFKTKNREYSRSIESDNLVLDIDSKGLVVGVQIFEASKFLKITPLNLREVHKWEFSTKVDRIKVGKKEFTRIELRLTFNVKIRNKLVEKNPIILQPITEKLPNSELVCAI